MAKVKRVKFTAAEMAGEAPPEVDFLSGLVIRGTPAWRKFLAAKRDYARLAPDVRKAFPDDKSVNSALRSLINSGALKQKPNGIHPRKSA